MVTSFLSPSCTGGDDILAMAKLALPPSACPHAPGPVSLSLSSDELLLFFSLSISLGHIQGCIPRHKSMVSLRTSVGIGLLAAASAFSTGPALPLSRAQGSALAPQHPPALRRSEASISLQVTVRHVARQRPRARGAPLQLRLAPPCRMAATAKSGNVCVSDKLTR